MKFIEIGSHRYIDSMTPDEWKVILDNLEVHQTSRARELREIAKLDQCWLPCTIGQMGFDTVNRFLKRSDLPYRLSSEPPNAPWADPDKKLRFQTLDDYIQSRQRFRKPRTIKPPP